MEGPTDARQRTIRRYWREALKEAENTVNVPLLIPSIIFSNYPLDHRNECDKAQARFGSSFSSADTSVWYDRHLAKQGAYESYLAYKENNALWFLGPLFFPYHVAASSDEFLQSLLSYYAGKACFHQLHLPLAVIFDTVAGKVSSNYVYGLDAFCGYVFEAARFGWGSVDKHLDVVEEWTPIEVRGWLERVHEEVRNEDRRERVMDALMENPLVLRDPLALIRDVDVLIADTKERKETIERTFQEIVQRSAFAQSLSSIDTKVVRPRKVAAKATHPF